jgi:DNA modification methylase
MTAACVLFNSRIIINMAYRMQEKPEWGKLATFVPNKELPVYNWFYYKEGFARDLAMKLIRMFSPDSVLDPFCGAGTTLLACRERSIPSAGFDVHPVAVFAAMVKTSGYDPKLLEETARSVIRKKRIKGFEVEVNDVLIRKAFPMRTMRETLYYRDLIMGIGNPSVRNFMMLGLMNVSIKSSFVYKDGAVIKIRKKPVPPIRDMLRRQLFRMIRDYRGFPKTDVETTADFGDARMLKLPDNSIHSVITSPPYLNKIEYTRIYEIEQKLFLDYIAPRPPIRSYIGISPEREANLTMKLADVLGEQELPAEGVPYLLDMYESIKGMHKVMKDGGKVGLVVGNGCFPKEGKVVESDLLLSRMAEHIGFRVDKIIVLNKRWCTRNRTEKVGVTRESLCLWEK